MGACSIRFRRQVDDGWTHRQEGEPLLPRRVRRHQPHDRQGTSATGTTASPPARRPSAPLAEIAKRKHDGEYRSPDRITLADYLNDRWLPLKKSQLSRSTFDSYRNNVRLHVAPRIGSIQLRQLQPEDLDTLYAELLVDGKLNGAGGGLAPKTVRNIHGMLRKALADAHRKGTVHRNVADLADPPKVRTGGAKDHQVWSADELRSFLAAIEDSDWFAPIYLAANTGMRRGELLGLTWRNVDLDKARLVVDQQLLSVGYDAEVGAPKTSTSRRTIDLDPRTVAVLRTWRRLQLEQLMANGTRNDGDFVFTHPRRRAGPPRPLLEGVGPARRRARPTPHPPPRPPPHPRLDPAEGERPREGRQRTPRPQQPRVHDDRVPTRPPRHAGRRRSGVRRRRVR